MKPEDVKIAAAQICHEANRAWCLANGDDSQPLWDDAPDWQKDSARQGVEFHLANPNASDSASHDNWMAQKVADGWVYGEVKDPEATPPTHPCIVPFDQLPVFQQVKDALFRAIVHSTAVRLLGTSEGQPEGEQAKSTDITAKDFNPSNNQMVALIKGKANELADAINQLPPSRRRSIALTNLETASMFSVKAVFYNDENERTDA